MVGQRKKPLTKTELAASMGWRSSAQLSKPQFRDMPSFYDPADFKKWYAARRSKPGRAVSNFSGISDTGRENIPPSKVNIANMLRPGDFDELVIEDSEKVVQIAYGLLENALKDSDPALITSCLKNWSEAAKQGKDIRGGYLQILENRKTLVRLDEVFALLGPILSELRNFLRRLGSAVCNEANPDKPAVARAAVEKAIDKFMLTLEASEQNLLSDLKTDEVAT